MRAVDVIAHKRDGQALSTEEIDWFIKGFVNGEVPDYQAAAWLMAVTLRGMTRAETVELTLAMARSGDMLDLSDVLPRSVDKHSSGGVGDKTSLVVLPLVAACGVPVAKMSGRGLGFSGGTLDKLESIPGYRVTLSPEEFREQARVYGIVLAGQSLNLTPADSKLYALRDVTGTVQSLPLIASSIMSKKIAAGAHAIVLDVKVGLGAFMTHMFEAEALARIMVEIGRDAGRDVVALICDMNQPLGAAVGNALEVREAIDTLHDGGPQDFREHCLAVAGHMIRLARQDKSEYALAESMAEAADRLKDGTAFQKFRTLVKAQGGDVAFVDDPARLPRARTIEPITAERSGYIEQLSALQIGLASVDLGAGRERKGDTIDHAVGLVVHKKIGDKVEIDEPLMTLHANEPGRLSQAKARLVNAVAYSSAPIAPLPTIYNTIYG